MLSKTGYVAPLHVKRILVILFLLDMVRYTSDHISEKDYCEIHKFLRQLEADDCLIPYSVYCTNRTQYFGYDDNFSQIEQPEIITLGDFNTDFNNSFFVKKITHG